MTSETPFKKSFQIYLNYLLVFEQSLEVLFGLDRLVVEVLELEGEVSDHPQEGGPVGRTLHLLGQLSDQTKVSYLAFAYLISVRAFSSNVPTLL